MAVSRIKIIITSRPHVPVKLHLPNIIELPLVAEDLKNDITAFVESEVSKQMQFAGGLGKEVRQTLIEGAKGMFLWVSLILDDLTNSTDTTPSAIRNALKALPPDLTGVYINILRKIPEKDQKIAQTMLQWVVWAIRPLTLKELTIAVAILPKHSSMASMHDDMQTDLRKVLQLVLGPMLRIQDDKTVHLVHQSAKDFLSNNVAARASSSSHPISTLRVSSAESNLQLALTCLTYLSFEESEAGPIEYSWYDACPEMEIRRKNSPFLDYAATHWPEHARHTDSTCAKHQLLCSVFRKLSESPRKLGLAYQVYTFSMRNKFVQTPPLQVAASFGLGALIKDMLDEDHGCHINAGGGIYGTALQTAAVKGCEAIIYLLLDRGADINAQGGYYGNVLQAAANDGQKALVRLLLDRGANINTQGGYYDNALQAAANGGHETVVRLLLDMGAEINAQGGKHGNALQAAAKFGNEAIGCMLLDRGADINSQGGKHGNALQAAAKVGDEAVVRLLLDRGADINAHGGVHSNALQAAANDGHEAVVRLLLDRGADINASCHHRGNALQIAAKEGHEAVVRLLLDRGADVNA